MTLCYSNGSTTFIWRKGGSSEHSWLLDQRHCHASPRHHFFQPFILTAFKEYGGEESQLSSNGFILWSDVKPGHIRKNKRHFYGKKKIYPFKNKKETCQCVPQGKGMGQLETSWVCQNNDNGSNFLHSSDTCSDSSDERGINSRVC